MRVGERDPERDPCPADHRDQNGQAEKNQQEVEIAPMPGASGCEAPANP